MLFSRQLTTNTFRLMTPIGKRFLSGHTLRINSQAPNFDVDSTIGKLNFYEYLGDSWGVLFSHPADFTPVCTTEMSAFAKLKPEFDKRNVKLIGLSVEDVESHNKWIKDIEDISGEFGFNLNSNDKFGFPIIGDVDKKVSMLYDMVDEEAFKKLQDGAKDKKGIDVATIRSVFIIDPKKKIRLSFNYPGSVGRNTSEVLRCIDALQLSDSKGVVTPANWSVNDDFIIPPKVSDQEAKEKFGDFKKIKPYLRLTKG
ncbi:thioredoxin peroxidase PRX1 NDAI_0E04200 [Naumovozyma dairenensis CBS 421]|uniref:Thioredoxin domain-containing protein n=1 Tax=Naumovozyma dairenensis (strain ATCC 10597 / BCRC 20456 / CBS 421 / NBRC 0211 / NRRL Y-12639) TaxID=1071378 RepID=G0WBW7_NAUDC|nr:hypothetical protein NDAI_0E04200 [Naumovozyma dairenensis CBS 421]CCD25237.1 hypothetical protein NDAI_0E04200 [Naumovozyma dairenensis CBS 421]